MRKVIVRNLYEMEKLFGEYISTISDSLTLSVAEQGVVFAAVLQYFLILVYRYRYIFLKFLSFLSQFTLYFGFLVNFLDRGT